jgi:hypothetical protein
MARLARDVQHILERYARAEATLNYKELGSLLNPALYQRDPKLRAALVIVSEEAHRAGRGLLSVLVVRSDTKLPSDGFVELAANLGRDVSNRRLCFERERTRVYREYAQT